MNPPTPTSVIVINTFARPINSANKGAGTNNPDGSFNASGTNRGDGNEHPLPVFNLLRSTGKISRKTGVTVSIVATANPGNWRHAA